MYCGERWNISRTRAHEYIQASDIAKRISQVFAIANIPKPRESQLRPLIAVKKEHQAEVWKQAVETAPQGVVTAKHVSNVVKLQPRERLAPKRVEAKEVEQHLERSATHHF